MNTQTTIFDAIAAREAKDRGLTRASKNPLLPVAQAIAIELGRKQSLVTADDVQAALMEKGYPEGSLGNSAGAIFSKAKWEWIAYTKSKRVIGHGNIISQWSLKRQMEAK